MSASTSTLDRRSRNQTFKEEYKKAWDFIKPSKKEITMRKVQAVLLNYWIMLVMWKVNQFYWTTIYFVNDVKLRSFIGLPYIVSSDVKC